MGLKLQESSCWSRIRGSVSSESCSLLISSRVVSVAGRTPQLHTWCSLSLLSLNIPTRVEMAWSMPFTHLNTLLSDLPHVCREFCLQKFLPTSAILWFCTMLSEVWCSRWKIWDSWARGKNKGKRKSNTIYFPVSLLFLIYNKLLESLQASASHLILPIICIKRSSYLLERSSCLLSSH